MMVGRNDEVEVTEGLRRKEYRNPGTGRIWTDSR